MTAHLSRRELLAWLGVGAGAAIGGASVLSNRGDGDVARTTTSPTQPPAATDRSAVSPPSDVLTSADRPAPTTTDRMLVVLEMPGGNDSLSMAVPYGIGAYYDRRDQTVIAAADVLRIDDEVGLHPNLTRLHERGITLVDGVGSMRPDGSHFEMQSRWWAGESEVSSINGGIDTGWIGRLADTLGTDSAPAAAVSIGSGAHPIVRSATGSTLSLPSADAVWAVTGADTDDEIRTTYQRALRAFAGSDSAFGRTLAQTIDFADAIVAMEDDVDRDALGYEGWDLAPGLSFAAQLLAADAGVRVVHVSMNGDFDTHEGHAWRHPELMQDLDTNLAAFHGDLDRRGLGEQVMVMTTSEFGRTLAENGSAGLDHGTASSMFLSGPSTGGRRGELPSLTDLDENDDLEATVPFESYLGGVIEGWLDVPASEVFPGSAPLDVVA